jgi:hypothetical protein
MNHTEDRPLRPLHVLIDTVVPGTDLRLHELLKAGFAAASQVVQTPEAFLGSLDWQPEAILV